MPSASFYQGLYACPLLHYGQATFDCCPGVRLFPLYYKWLISPVIDIGCGTGDTLNLLKTHRFTGTGIDQVDTGKHLIGDITKPIAGIDLYQCALCIDVLEHLTDEQVAGVFDNLVLTQRQVISIHNGSSVEGGQELHINRKAFSEWENALSKRFTIKEAIVIHDRQTLYLTVTGG